MSKILFVFFFLFGLLNISIYATQDIEHFKNEHLKEIHNNVFFTNINRQANNIHPLKINYSSLEQSAMWYAQDMNKYSYFHYSHTDLFGRTIKMRISDFGYTGTRVGENIAWRKDSVSTVIDQLMASPPHRQNILNSQFTEVGIGRVFDGNYSYYWVQDFGNSLQNYIVIDNEKFETDNPNVNLYIYNTTPNITNIRFSNDGINYSQWEDFSNTKKWRLDSNEGYKTVYTQLTNGNATYQYTDDIVLNIKDTLGIYTKKSNTISTKEIKSIMSNILIKIRTDIFDKF